MSKITKITTSFSSDSTIQFLVDDDPKMHWLRSFGDEGFKRYFVFIDKNVNKLWGSLIYENLKTHGKEIFSFEVEPNESSKSIDFYPEAVSFLEERRCNRFDLVIAIGGGVVIDLASFVASTYMRGIPLYIIATTLIGQVDASTAGKTCLNTKSCKNLLGTFYFPLTVYNNINFLNTSPERILRQGFSEIFKYGLLGSKRLIEQLVQYQCSKPDTMLLNIIERTIMVRVKIRKKHPLASNLGHTFGHAIEKLSNYEILHGDAISVGIIIALHLSKELGIIGGDLIQKIVDKIKLLGLNLYIDNTIDVDRMLEVMMRDKKASHGDLNLVLIKDIAQPYEHKGSSFYRIKPNEVKLFLKDFLASYEYCIPDCSRFLEKDITNYKGR